MVSGGGNIELGAITHWLSGGTPSRSVEHYWSGDIPWISATTLKKIDVSESDQCVTSEAVAAGSKMAPVNSTLLLVRGSALHNEIRAGIVCKPVCFNQDVKALVPSKDVHPRYLTYSILGRESELLKLVSSAGNTAGVLDTKLVQSFQIWLPELEEQRAIATALSDVDALLEELDRLIAKKRDIKQATMQKLLTGETRLPGFDGEWETRQLGEVIEKLDAGVSVNSTTDMAVEGRPSVLKTSALENGTLDISETKVIVEKDLTRATITLKKDTILVSRMNTPNLVGETAYVTDDLTWIYLPDRIWMAQFKKSASVCVKWMSYMLCSPSYRNALREMATGTSGSMKNISKPALLSLRMKFPKQSEQEAIANAISDIDAEIQALEQRRSKTAELKQGMMQELLTGRTRLV